ncbi:MAG: galactose/methyl galactoside ABC transporter permease MglC [Spirochaetaceae bacterium]|jgi:methyl-galactoside transport system permease protein|nr:galactose/methyl galactoside ABC transporter permease MglC [Spirochaetaceae bacterium]
MSTDLSKKLSRDTVKNFCLNNAISLVLVALIIFIAIREPGFISVRNLRNILTMSATRLIIALGVTGCLITAGTDLSAGRNVGLAAVISSSLLQAPDYPRRMYENLPSLPLIVPLLVAVVVCGLVGLVNGIVVAKLKVPPFIATLGTMVAAYGICSIYFDRPPYGAQPIGGLNKAFSALGTGYVGFGGNYSIPYIVLIAAAFTLVMWILYNKTRLGKNIYAIGGNMEAARVSGVNVTKTLIIVYIIAGCMYAIGGSLEAARTGGATNNYGNGYELDAIAACVVGGVSVYGGIGTVPGVVVGVLIFSVINYGLTFINVNPYWQQIIKGVIIVAAVAIDIKKYLVRR